MPQTVSKVIIVEGPNPLDLLEGRGERSSLEQVCRLFGHHVASFFVRDEAELRQTLTYVASISRHPGAGSDPLFVHVSVHGDADGISVGPDTVSWDDLSEMAVQMYSDLDNYAGPVILVLSACGANQQKLTRLLKAKRDGFEVIHPPEYVFVFTDSTVLWTDAVVAWTIFYSQIDTVKFSSSRKDIREIQKILGRLRESALAKLTYYRWDDGDETYKRYDSKRAAKAQAAAPRKAS